MKHLLSSLLIGITLAGCIQSEKDYYIKNGIHFMTPEESKKFEENNIMITIDVRGYLMLIGKINGNPISCNLDSVYMIMHNERTKSHNIYDERIAVK